MGIFDWLALSRDFDVRAEDCETFIFTLKMEKEREVSINFDKLKIYSIKFAQYLYNVFNLEAVELWALECVDLFVHFKPKVKDCISWSICSPLLDLINNNFPPKVIYCINWILNMKVKFFILVYLIIRIYQPPLTGVAFYLIDMVPPLMFASDTLFPRGTPMYLYFTDKNMYDGDQVTVNDMIHKGVPRESFLARIVHKYMNDHPEILAGVTSRLDPQLHSQSLDLSGGGSVFVQTPAKLNPLNLDRTSSSCSLDLRSLLTKKLQHNIYPRFFTRQYSPHIELASQTRETDLETDQSLGPIYPDYVLPINSQTKLSDIAEQIANVMGLKEGDGRHILFSEHQINFHDIGAQSLEFVKDDPSKTQLILKKEKVLNDKEYVFYIVSTHTLCDVDVVNEVASVKSYQNLMIYLIICMLATPVFWIVGIILWIPEMLPIIGSFISALHTVAQIVFYIGIAYPDFSNSRYIMNEFLCWIMSGTKSAGKKIETMGLSSVPYIGWIFGLPEIIIRNSELLTSYAMSMFHVSR
jgi:hypothetical protein